MVRTVGYQDPGRLEMIRRLEKASRESGSRLWAAVANDLSSARKRRREINVHKIDKHTVEGEYVVVPGKVLGDGNMGHKVNVAAYKFTSGAERKIKDAGGKTMGILELIKINPKGNKVRLMG